jgi:hypothetical protein
MGAQHTPGPWAVTSSKGDVHSQARNGQNWICQGPNDSVSAPFASEREANARLIAAAPKLLAALRLQIKEWHEQGCPTAFAPVDECMHCFGIRRQVALAAIAEATGAA